MAEQQPGSLLSRLRAALPTVQERETVWCSVRGDDLRAVVDTLSRLQADNKQAATLLVKQAELIARLQAVGGEVVAWHWEGLDQFDEDKGLLHLKWTPHAGTAKPEPSARVRNVRPLVYGDTHPAAPAKLPVSLDVTLRDDAAELLKQMLSGDPDEVTPVRLLTGDGHSGYGLYAAEAECQEEGATLLASLPAPTAAPALTLADGGDGGAHG